MFLIQLKKRQQGHKKKSVEPEFICTEALVSLKIK